VSDLEITAIGGADVDGPLHAELVELYDLSYREPPWNETDVDHAAQLGGLGAALPAGSRLWEVDCLGPCERSNVVVVRTGTRRRWFGGVLDPEITTTLAAWITSGPSGPPPAAVAALEFLPDDA
jgi:hypothetical protein